MRLLVIMAMACALLSGCKDTVDKIENPGVENARTTTVSYVCVGMEYSKRFGECPGCRLDSARVDVLLRETFGYKGVLLQSEQATRDAVVKAMTDAISATPADGMFILYYSGHGGRENLHSSATTEPAGADPEDEYLCLYDTYLLDDDIWSIISKCRGRLFLIFDCCHSQTMYRSVAPDVALSRGLGVALEAKTVKSTGFFLSPRGVALGTDGFRMLCWSGCMEKEYSFGSSGGGVMTNSMLRRWKRGITYSTLWGMIESDVTEAQPTQHPRSTQYGAGFEEAFR